jgi:uncharacterized protein YciI
LESRAAQSAANKSRASAKAERLEVAAIAADKLAKSYRKSHGQRDRERAAHRRLLEEQTERDNHSRFLASAREADLENGLLALEAKFAEAAMKSSAAAHVHAGELQVLKDKLQRVGAAQAARNEGHATQACALKQANASRLVVLEARLAEADSVASARVRELETQVNAFAGDAELRPIVGLWQRRAARLEEKLHEIGEHAYVGDADYNALAPHLQQRLNAIAALADCDPNDSSEYDDDGADDADDSSVATDDSVDDAREDGTADAEEGEAVQVDECGVILGLLPSLDVSATLVRVIQALRTASCATLTRLATNFRVLTGDSADVYERSIADAILEVFDRCGRLNPRAA